MRCRGAAACNRNERHHGSNAARELASRENDWLAVVLFWNPSNHAVTLAIADSRTGARFELVVDRERALDAFYHPFAYAA